jgi:hypothetical protein
MTDTPEQPKPTKEAEAEAYLGGQIARLTGAVRTNSELVAKLTDTFDQFRRATRAMGSGPPPPPDPSAAFAATPDPSRPVVVQPPPPARKLTDGDEAGRAAEAAVRARQEDAAKDPSLTQQLAEVLRTLAEAGRRALAARGVTPGRSPARATMASMTDWARRQTGRAKAWLGRRLEKAPRWVRRAVAGAKVGSKAGARAATGAVGGVAVGARAGGTLGAVGGPLGAVGGAVVGVVAAAGLALFKAGATVFDTLAKSITRYLHPVALMSSAINAQTSGYSVLGKAHQVLASVIGLLLLPLFLSLAAAVMSVAGELAGPLSEASKQLGEVVIPGTVRALALFVTTIELAVGAVRALTDGFMAVYNSPLTKMAMGGAWTTNLGPLLAAAAKAVVGQNSTAAIAGEVAATAAPAVWQAAMDRMEKNEERLTGRGGRAEGGAGTFDGEAVTTDRGRGGGNRFNDMFRLAVMELRRGLGPKAESVNIADIGRQAQLAGLNASPFEQELLKIQRQALKTSEELLAVAEEQRSESRREIRPGRQ